MAGTFHQIYIQTVFAVKFRNAIIDKSWAAGLHEVIGNLISETGCKPMIVNGVEDHIHCLIGLKPVVSISDLMQVVKAKSSHFVNHQGLIPERFEWQGGYGVFSYSQADVDKVYKYIANQEQHHQKQSFLDEYLGMIEKFDVPHDDRFLFAPLA